MSTPMLPGRGRGYLWAASAMVEGRLELPEATGVSGASGGPEEAAVSPGHKHTAERGSEEGLGLGPGLGLSLGVGLGLGQSLDLGLGPSKGPGLGSGPGQSSYPSWWPRCRFGGPVHCSPS